MQPSDDQIIRNIGRRIRELRLAQDFTQEQAAESLGIAIRNYQAMERGRQNLTLRTMLRIARLLGVELPALFEPPMETEVPAGRPRRKP